MNWNTTVAEIGPKLYRFFAASFSAETASDLTQETLIRLVQKYEQGKFDPGQGSLLMYAYGIARFVQLEARKKGEGHWAGLDEAMEVASAEASAVEEEIRELRLAIEHLSEIQKHIVLLHIDQDLTLQDIGILTGVPLNTVKSHIHRAKEILRTQMKQREEGIFYERK